MALYGNPLILHQFSRLAIADTWIVSVHCRCIRAGWRLLPIVRCKDHRRPFFAEDGLLAQTSYDSALETIWSKRAKKRLRLKVQRIELQSGFRALLLNRAAKHRFLLKALNPLLGNAIDAAVDKTMKRICAVKKRS